MIEYMTCCTNIKYQADHISESEKKKTAYVYSCDGQSYSSVMVYNPHKVHLGTTSKSERGSFVISNDNRPAHRRLSFKVALYLVFR